MYVIVVQGVVLESSLDAMKIDELYNRHVQRIETHRRTYKTIQRMCEAHIRAVNESGGMQTVYTVPPFVYGEPMFDQTRAAEFITRRLAKGGFRTFREGIRIHIDWRPDREMAQSLAQKASMTTSKGEEVSTVHKPWIEYTTPQIQEQQRAASTNTTTCPEIRTIRLSNDRLESHIRNLSRSSHR